MTPERAPPAGLLARLPEGHRPVLARAAQLAAAQGAGLWLVGGVVRDLLLGVDPGRDVDLAVEGDAPALAASLATELGGRILATHAPFGTATLEVSAGPESLLLDLARTRVERYPRPAALPEVRPAPVAADLIRRDFSINAIALELRADAGGLAAGRLLDPHGGQLDLAAGMLRLLHPNSLRDDPTRILRGLRLAARLRLRLDPGSQAQLGQALRERYLSLLSSERVLAELCLALEEPRPDAALRLADSWGVTPQILPWLAWGSGLAARCERLALATDIAEPDRPLVWAGLLLYELGGPELAALAGRYPLPTEAAELLRELPQLRALAPELASPLPNSAVDRLLRPFSSTAVAVLHYAEPAAARAAERYGRVLHHTRSPLDGRDLQRLGVAPGPGLGKLLAELRAAVLDGAVTTRAEAERWVQARLSNIRAAEK
jgi:tRNA nucleotidyltransferase (CCA-adding enzyme)